MKPIIITNAETIKRTNYHHKYNGDSFKLIHPYEMNFPVVWQDDPEETTFSNKREYTHRAEINVQGRVWKELHKSGKYYEKINIETFLHKKLIDEGFRVGDANFLEAYKGRFLYCTDPSDNPRFKEYWICDMKHQERNPEGSFFTWTTKPKLYKVRKLETFQEFKEKLKELNLI